MGRSVNKVQLIGTLGRDPEMAYLPSGSAVVNLSIATDESYNDKKSGQKVDKTEWHKIAAFGKLAEIIGQYLKKGSKAYFEGKLQTDEYEKDGIKRYSTKIVAFEMMMLDGKQDDQQQGQPAQNMQQPAQGGYTQQPQQRAQQPAQGYAQQSGGATQQRQVQQPNQQPQAGNFSDDIPFSNYQLKAFFA